MSIFAGLAVSDKTTHICAVDADGVVLKRDVMRSDALSGADQLGVRALIQDSAAYVTYPMSMICWTKSER